MILFSLLAAVPRETNKWTKWAHGIENDWKNRSFHSLMNTIERKSLTENDLRFFFVFGRPVNRRWRSRKRKFSVDDQNMKLFFFCCKIERKRRKQFLFISWLRQLMSRLTDGNAFHEAQKRNEMHFWWRKKFFIADGNEINESHFIWVWERRVFGAERRQPVAIGWHGQFTWFSRLQRKQRQKHGRIERKCCTWENHKIFTMSAFRVYSLCMDESESFWQRNCQV